MASSTTTTNQSPIARYIGNFYFEDGMLLTGILVTLLYLTVGVSLDAAGHVPSMALLIPVSLGATVLAMLMSYSRFDGFFALSHSMFTGLAWILFLMAGMVKEKEIESFLDFGIPELQSRVYFVLWKLLNWVDAAISNSASNDNYVFIFEISFLIWWLTYLGVWTIFRYGHTWRAIMPAGMVLLINTYYAPKSVVGFLIVFSLLGLILLVRTNLAEQQLRWREQRIHFNQDITFDFLRSGFYYSVVVLSIAWLAPGLGRSPQVRDLLSPLNERYEDISRRVDELYGGIEKQTRPNTAAFGDSLTLSGERSVDGSLVFSVSTAQGRYWRAVAFDTFDGRRWLNTVETETEFDADVPVAAPAWELRKPLTQTISLLAPMGDVIVGAPDIRRVSVPVRAVGQLSPAAALDTIVANPNEPAPPGNEIVYARATDSLDVGDSYTVLSQFAEVTTQALENAGTAYPQAILDKYLQLPENFSERVAQTALTVTLGTETPYAQAKALETYLRTNYTYNDAIPAPPEDVDPVEYFLYDLRQGYCDYYATAMVLMLRSLGIPARAASGYAEGTYDEETFQFYISDRDAHTWVEVFFPNLGWIEFEPTAGETPLERPTDNGMSQAEGAPSPVPNNGSPNAPVDPALEELQNEQLTQPDTGALDESGSGGGGRWWLWALLTPVVLLAGLWGLRRTQMLGPTTFTPELPPILFERMQRWAERLGLRTRASDTPYEQARTFGRSLPDGQPFIAEITASYVHYRFSRQDASPLSMDNSAVSSTGERVVTAWQRLQPIFWRAWGRKVTASILRRKQSPFTLMRE